MLVCQQKKALKLSVAGLFVLYVQIGNLVFLKVDYPIKIY